MLQQDVDSLEELEEIKRFEAIALADQAKNNLPAYAPYDFLADMDSLFDL